MSVMTDTEYVQHFSRVKDADYYVGKFLRDDRAIDSCSLAEIKESTGATNVSVYDELVGSHNQAPGELLLFLEEDEITDYQWGQE